MTSLQERQWNETFDDEDPNQQTCLVWPLWVPLHSASSPSRHSVAELIPDFRDHGSYWCACTERVLLRVEDAKRSAPCAQHPRRNECQRGLVSDCLNRIRPKLDSWIYEETGERLFRVVKG